MARQTLESFIRDALTDKDKDGPCTSISLVHRGGAGGQQELEVHTTKLAGRTVDPHDLAVMFKNKADGYSQDLPGVQYFSLLFFYRGSNQAEARFPFLVNGKTDLDGATEGPDEKGRTQQGMRHAEMLIQQVYRRQQILDDFQLRLLERADRRIHTLEQENRDMFDIFRQVMLDKITAENNQQMQRLEFERKTKEREKLLTFAPALINTILGREVFPQSTADTALVETIAESLGPEDVEKLISSGVIKPELMGPLFNRLSQVMQKKEAEREKQKLLSPSVSDPEADAMGEVQK